jgi:hypothetical protein
VWALSNRNLLNCKEFMRMKALKLLRNCTTWLKLSSTKSTLTNQSHFLKQSPCATEYLLSYKDRRSESEKRTPLKFYWLKHSQLQCWMNLKREFVVESNYEVYHNCHALNHWSLSSISLAKWTNIMEEEQKSLQLNIHNQLRNNFTAATKQCGKQT